MAHVASYTHVLFRPTPSRYRGPARRVLEGYLQEKHSLSLCLRQLLVYTYRIRMAISVSYTHVSFRPTPVPLYCCACARMAAGSFKSIGWLCVHSRHPDQREGLLHTRDGVQGLALSQEEEVLRGAHFRRGPRALRQVRQGLEQVHNGCSSRYHTTRNGGMLSRDENCAWNLECDISHGM